MQLQCRVPHFLSLSLLSVLRILPGSGTREIVISRNGVKSGMYMVRILREGIQTGALRLVFE